MGAGETVKSVCCARGPKFSYHYIHVVWLTTAYNSRWRDALFCLLWVSLPTPPPTYAHTNTHRDTYAGAFFFFLLSLGGIKTLPWKETVFNKCRGLENFRPELLAKRLCISYNTSVSVMTRLSSVDPRDNQFPALQSQCTLQFFHVRLPREHKKFWNCAWLLG